MDKELLNKILPYCRHGLKAIHKEDVANFESLEKNPYAD